MLDPSIKDGEYNDEEQRAKHRGQLKTLVKLYEAARSRARASNKATGSLPPTTPTSDSTIRAKLHAKIFTCAFGGGATWYVEGPDLPPVPLLPPATCSFFHSRNMAVTI
ncbi:hypothetical protein RvY_19507 [Ramazzottius varieornatus]|uniref:Uncharacterized protein n=1 Tax=Ramazzottius varieornatus TaxID=947166 RepID=A0A1D1WB68_RAMVA|nr:hypothetical protein RvY_19484 [Ramazzottius varieornatus]GAV10018.1 hypothetical protein RvY_19507 [Ramazzottius varieornatus]